MESNKKKIILVGPAYPLRGGNALFIAHLYELLSRQYNVKVISFSKLYPKLLFPGVRQNDISSEGMKVHPAEHIIDSANPFSWRRAAKAIRNFAPDALVLNWWQPFFGPLMNYLSKKFLSSMGHGKLVFIAENVISHESRSIDRVFTKLALRHAESFITLSGSVESEIKRLYPNVPQWRAALPIYDCYKPKANLNLDDAKHALGLTDKKVILFFGYVRKYKGLDNLIKAMPALIKQLPEAHLLIVGEFYDSPEEYMKLISDTGIAHNVTIINEYVANEEVGRFYSAADMVALPYNSATQSGILNIAFGFRKPVIVTDVGGLGESIDNGVNGMVIPPASPQALSDALIEFFCSEKGATITENIKTANLNNDFEKILQAFKEILT